MEQETNKGSSAGVKILSFIIGLAAIACAVIMFIKPDSSVAVLFCILLLGLGIRGIIAYVSNKQARNIWQLISSIISLLAGFIFLADITALLPIGIVTEFIIGVWAGIMGLLRIINSLLLKRDGFTGLGWMLFSGSVLLLIGVFLVVNTLAGLLPLFNFAGRIIGGFLLLIGIGIIIESFTNTMPL